VKVEPDEKVPVFGAISKEVIAEVERHISQQIILLSLQRLNRE
jgi:hypothetical protein